MVNAACVHLWNMRNATRPKALREGSAGKPREGVDNGGTRPVDQCFPRGGLNMHLPFYQNSTLRPWFEIE